MAAGDWPVTCDDSYGDGWHGGYIEIDGNKYCDDFTTGKLQDLLLIRIFVYRIKGSKWKKLPAKFSKKRQIFGFI